MRSRTGGSSLIEVIVSITILGLVVVPLCTCLVTAHRINAKSEALLREQLAASNAMESLQARGYNADNKAAVESAYSVTVTATKENETDTFYTVTVKCGDDDNDGIYDVEFTSVIREGGAS